MTADIDERVGLVGGEPVLEVGGTVVIRFDHLGFAHCEAAEVSLTVLTAGQQGRGGRNACGIPHRRKALFHGQAFRFRRPAHASTPAV